MYPGASGKFVIYEDAGDGYDYESGTFSLIEIRWHDQDLIVNFRKGEW
ncbi:DUF5110 domain-containing protein [Alicyclobacillus fodiniaquatilis]|uniref:DUF5110 domain-containing protein n=1 Tax=Alicyclobacillus fodiniaquatilis TaxID=1661150 RepID=A0ABW4JDB3_9BACL